MPSSDLVSGRDTGPHRGPGRSTQELNRTRVAGKNWRTACAQFLRALGWTGADAQTRNLASDLTGTWDLAVECTITTWDKIWMKLDQAERDACERGLTLWCVWKKRNGTTNPGDGAVLMPAALFFPMVMRLEKLEQASLEAGDQFTRGFTAGVDYARRHPGPAGHCASCDMHACQDEEAV